MGETLRCKHCGQAVRGKRAVEVMREVEKRDELETKKQELLKSVEYAAESMNRRHERAMYALRHWYEAQIAIIEGEERTE